VYELSYQVCIEYLLCARHQECSCEQVTVSALLGYGRGKKKSLNDKRVTPNLTKDKGSQRRGR
jgi:hypothetical protein